VLHDAAFSLIMVASKSDNRIEQTIVGNEDSGIIFYIGNGEGRVVDRVDPNLLRLFEETCKSSGVRSISCLYRRQLAPLVHSPGYSLKDVGRNGRRIVKNFES
jgi:hypothetical protein